MQFLFFTPFQNFWKVETPVPPHEVYKEICGFFISKVLFADQAEAVGISLNTTLLESKVQENGLRNARYCILLRLVLAYCKSIQKGRRNQPLEPSSLSVLRCWEYLQDKVKYKASFMR
ncbi:hypothetical protein L6452_15913 [Arctium lappa]|uniref:Uncharacterized protein n=1 Tax=Arctium lappa TaxID=4217 RepID=A0ACB9CPZ0_ARCLA|nr:hypothetical protein L6452_15913 [Arctium lappa]